MKSVKSAKRVVASNQSAGVRESDDPSAEAWRGNFWREQPPRRGDNQADEGRRDCWQGAAARQQVIGLPPAPGF